MSFFGDLFYPDNPRRRESVNALQQDILRIARAAALAVHDHNELLTRYETVHSANGALLGRPLPSLRVNAIALQQVPRVDGATDSVSEFLDSVQSILGPVPLMGLIGGGTERSVLEEAIGRLNGIRTCLASELASITSTNSVLAAGILGAVQQFAAIRRGLADLVPMDDSAALDVRDPMRVDPVIEAQQRLLADAGRWLQVMALFRKKWAGDFAVGREPDQERRNGAYDDLAAYGLLANADEGERVYQAMRRLDQQAP